MGKSEMMVSHKLLKVKKMDDIMVEIANLYFHQKFRLF